MSADAERLKGKRVFEQDTDKAGPDPVEEAGDTTAAASIPTPVDTRPVGQGTTADVEGDSE
jgi:hypothetical protein